MTTYIVTSDPVFYHFSHTCTKITWYFQSLELEKIIVKLYELIKANEVEMGTYCLCTSFPIYKTGMIVVSTSLTNYLQNLL